MSAVWKISLLETLSLRLFVFVKFCLKRTKKVWSIKWYTLCWSSPLIQYALKMQMGILWANTGLWDKKTIDKQMNTN
jgi:hypothetical protein